MRVSRALLVRILPLLLSGALLPRCSTTDTLGGSPVDPVSSSTSGTLDLTVHEVGALPDTDGFEVTITLESADAPAVRVFSAGSGALHFPELPPGIHTLRFEGLADPCSVTGSYPRLFAIFAGETTRLDVFISCPGPGAILVRTVTGGADFGDGYTVSVTGSAVSLFPIGPNDSLRIDEADLPDGTDWRVDLADVPGNCSVDAPARYVGPLKGTTAEREFHVVCLARGSRIAFRNRSGVSVTEGGEARLLSAGATLGGPSLSPDGARVLFLTVDFDGEPAVGIAAADGTGETSWILSPGGFASIGSQAWSPDGSRIVFSQRSDRSVDLYTMNLDGSGQTRLTFGGWNGYAAWSPDGRSIAFCRLEGEVFLEYFVLYRIELDGSGERRLDEGGCYPAWSPDGSRIAYARWWGPDQELVVSDSDGSNPILFRPEPVREVYEQLSWSPDGAWIAFSGGSLERIWLVEFDGSAFGTAIPYRSGAAPSWR